MAIDSGYWGNGAALDSGYWEFAEDTNVLTNADHIRSMTDEELAEWLDEELGCCCYCSEEKRLENEPLLRGEKCDEQCKKHLLDWLKQPYKEDT